MHFVGFHKTGSPFCLYDEWHTRCMPRHTCQAKKWSLKVTEMGYAVDPDQLDPSETAS